MSDSRDYIACIYCGHEMFEHFIEEHEQEHQEKGDEELEEYV